MNDDLISREALKESMRKSINERYISWTKTISVADIATLIFDEIVNAPTVLHDNYSMGYQDGVKKVLSERPHGEWILIGERLPDRFDDVLVTVLTASGELKVRSGFYADECFFLDTGNTWNWNDPEIKAWMPLPEAYKEE